MSSNNGTYDSQSSKEISLEKMLGILEGLNAKNVYIKKLSPNDNSKNQPYFGTHLTDLAFIPTGEVIASTSSSQKTNNPNRKIKYHAPLNFYWFDTNSCIYKAPHAKLIYYPQFPEVRLSGFLRNSDVDASRWMSSEKQGRSEGRWLIMGVSENNNIYSYLVTPEHNLSNELENTDFIKISNIIWKLNTQKTVPVESTRDALLSKLLEIHNLGWIESTKLNSNHISEPYKAPNGGGYTLESMLGITPNGIAEPDYLGWEVKQFGVNKLPKIGAKQTTLMTPEPNGGYYTTSGAIDFVKTYGYPDRNDKENRINFGGKHTIGNRHNRTNLTMQLLGYDTEKSIITDAEGAIVLLDDADNITASWSFAKLINHWKRKHSQAVYIPCIKRIQSGIYEYHYGKNIELGTGTSFEMVLSAMYLGLVFYDPGIKLQNATSLTPQLKRRSQFRVNHKNLNILYKQFEFIELES